MSDTAIIPVPEEWAKRAYVDDVGYRAKHVSAGRSRCVLGR